MAPQCDICFLRFDLNTHRPKCLPCGHTICKECVQNPGLRRKCPTCRKDMAADPGDLPDNIFAIRLMEDEGEPPCKVPRREDEMKVQQLQRAVEAGRKAVSILQQVVPVAVEALQQHLNSSVAELRQMEEALEQLQRGVAARDVNTMPDLDSVEESLRLLTTNKCTVVAEKGTTTWRSSVQLGRFDDVLRLLLLQLRAEGKLLKVEAAAAPAAPYVGPPGLSVLTISRADLREGHLKVNDILRSGQRWKHARSLKKLKGNGAERLLRVVGPQLEDLEVSDEVGPNFMAEVKEMKSLRRLVVTSDPQLWDYPELPLHLEELSIGYPSIDQLRCVPRMNRLRSLTVDEYFGPDVAFPASQHGGLLWLSVCLSLHHRATMLSLIRAHAPSLQELHIFSFCRAALDDHDDYYFPDLGQDLAACGLRALRRLVLKRPGRPADPDLAPVPCVEVDACLLQLRTIRGSLHHSVDVVCAACCRTVL